MYSFRRRNLQAPTTECSFFVLLFLMTHFGLDLPGSPGHVLDVAKENSYSFTVSYLVHQQPCKLDSRTLLPDSVNLSIDGSNPISLTHTGNPLINTYRQPIESYGQTFRLNNWRILSRLENSLGRWNSLETRMWVGCFSRYHCCLVSNSITILLTQLDFSIRSSCKWYAKSASWMVYNIYSILFFRNNQWMAGLGLYPPILSFFSSFASMSRTERWSPFGAMVRWTG